MRVQVRVNVRGRLVPNCGRFPGPEALTPRSTRTMSSSSLWSPSQSWTCQSWTCQSWMSRAGCQELDRGALEGHFPAGLPSA